MKTPQMLRIFYTLTLIFYAVLSFTQTPISLDSIFVSESKLRTLSSINGKSMTVLTGKSIERLPVNTVDELLRYIPGVNVNSRGAFGVQTDIGLRGSTFSQVLVLLDNMRINDPLTGHFNNNIPVALSEIHHIEIIRGIAASAYGSDAVGGLIHIKTKSYEASRIDKSVALSGNVAIGNHNLLLTDMGLVFKNGPLFGSASMKANISDGETLVNPNFTNGVSEDSLYNNYFDLRTYSASIGYQVSDKLKLYTRFGYDTRDFMAKYFYTASAYDESTEKTTSFWNQIAFRYNIGRHKMELDGALKKASDDFSFNPLFSKNEHTTDQLILNYNHEFSFQSGPRIAFGAQFIDKQIESNDRGDHDNKSIGIYGLIASRFLQYFHTTASIRGVHDENFGFEILPQVSLSYSRSNFTLKSSIGRAIRAADFTERYVSSQIPELSPGRNIGNPDLQAEISNAIDLGINLYFDKGLSFSSSIFFRESNNLIDFASTNADDISNVSNLQAGSDYYYATNIEDSETYGIELLLDKVYRFNSDYNLNLKASYTWLETVGINNELSKYVANHPKHNFAALIDFDVFRFNVSSTNNFIVRQNENIASINGEIPDAYFLSNLKIGYSAFENMSFYLQIQNLANTQYQEILGARLPSRWLLGGLKWDL